MKSLKSKQTRQFPSRGALLDLDKTQRTIADYGKLTPIKPMTVQPNVIENLRKSRI